MKAFFTCFLLITTQLICVNINAQASYEIAEDFILKDIDGNEHSLYQYLDEGKTVFVELFATWCGSCWSHHQEGYFKDLYEKRGPNGSDDVMILMVENDINTSIDGIYGDGSYGDWTDGTPYPIFNTETEAEKAIFGGGSFPKFLIFQPNRVVTEFTGVHFLGNYETIVDAAFPAASQPQDVAILEYTGDVNYCENINTSFVIQNLGTENLKELTTSVSFFKGLIMESILSVLELPEELAPYETTEIQINIPITIDESEAELTLQAIAKSDEDINNLNWYNELKVNLVRPTSETDTVFVNITTDNFGYETYWAILNENGEIVADGGNSEVGLNGGGAQSASSGGYTSNWTSNMGVPLEKGKCYDFIIVDDYADGLCCNNGNGSFSLSENTGKVIYEHDGRFGTSHTVMLKVAGETIEEPEDILAAIFTYSIDGYTVTFNNESTGSNIENHTWGFGDGYYDFTANPLAHIYGGAGVYPVSLYISNASGSAIYQENVVVGDVNTSISNLTNNSTIQVININNNEQLIRFTSNTLLNTEITIVNALGQLISSEKINIEVGVNEHKINTTSLPNGWYAIILNTKEKAIAERFLIMR